MNELRDSLKLSSKGWATCDFCLEKGPCVERTVSFRLLICASCVAKAVELFAPASDAAAWTDAEKSKLRPDIAAYLSKLELRDSWRKIACLKECGGGWGSNCPGCHDPIPEHFKAMWKLANLAKEAARHLPFVGDDIYGSNAPATELAKQIEEALRDAGIEPGEDLEGRGR